jgi:vancomycin resistance protein YoaR
MKEARYFQICSIVFLFLFIFNGCQTQALSSEEDSNLDGAFFDVMTLQEQISKKSEVSYSRSNRPMNDHKISIQADAILGEFKTSFSRSSKSRKQNIRTAASKINLTVVYPNEEFSICGILVPFTEENGYLPAGTIVEGKVINSYGGGVCQVSTTLYNAVLNAELIVLERHPHSIAVSYIEVGRDAAISENLKDFRFLNSLETPIIIEAITTQRDELIFRIRGIDIKSDTKRTITFETVILEEIKAGEPVIEYDNSQPQDYFKVTQSAHNGYKVELYRIVMKNGVETEREKISYSEYEASPQYVIVGSKTL